MTQICRRMPLHGLDHWPAWARVWLNVEVPQPFPGDEPLPPPPDPVPPSQEPPPGITEPTLPGQNEPVREPTVPSTLTMFGCLH